MQMAILQLAALRRYRSMLSMSNPNFLQANLISDMYQGTMVNLIQ